MYKDTLIAVRFRIEAGILLASTVRHYLHLVKFKFPDLDFSWQENSRWLSRDFFVTIKKGNTKHQEVFEYAAKGIKDFFFEHFNGE